MPPSPSFYLASLDSSSLRHDDIPLLLSSAKASVDSGRWHDASDSSKESKVHASIRWRIRWTYEVRNCAVMVWKWYGLVRIRIVKDDTDLWIDP